MKIGYVYISFVFQQFSAIDFMFLATVKMLTVRANGYHVRVKKHGNNLPLPSILSE